MAQSSKQSRCAVVD